MPGAAVAGTVDVLAEFGSPEFCRDPYPLIRWLREAEPVHRTGAGYFLVSRHADAERVLRDSGGEFRGLDRDEWAAVFGPAARHRSVRLLADSVLCHNPPEHTRLRRLVARSFTPRRAADLRDRIGETCDRLLDSVAGSLRGGEVVDLHRRLSRPLTVHVIATLLGVPEADRECLAGTVAGIVAGRAGGSPERLRIADEHAERQADFFADLIAHRRREPAGDLVSALADGDSDGRASGGGAAGRERLADGEIVAMLHNLWVAGFASTAAGIDHGAMAMLAHPVEARRWLGGHPGAVAFAAEVVRHSVGALFYSPGPRIAVRDVELSGVRVPAGSDVRPVFAAANRDPAVFRDPERFDPGRDNTRSLAFGAGIHHCLGAFLAREEMAAALIRLHRRFPGLVVAGEPTWSVHGGNRVPSQVPVMARCGRCL